MKDINNVLYRNVIFIFEWPAYCKIGRNYMYSTSVCVCVCLCVRDFDIFSVS